MMNIMQTEYKEVEYSIQHIIHTTHVADILYNTMNIYSSILNERQITRFNSYNINIFRLISRQVQIFIRFCTSLLTDCPTKKLKEAY